MKPLPRKAFEIGGAHVLPGRRSQVDLPIARLMSGTPVALPLIVFHGVADGPTVWLSGAIHGDEIGGVEIIRQVTEQLDPKRMAGTVIAIPIVNVHGFNTGDRYLPDRRDLNRSFPGSARGSLAGQIANLMMTTVVRRCSVGIDLHTGSDHRTNYPQIRADLDDDTTRQLATVFGAPVTVHSRTRDKSLREAATRAGATVLLFEGGEAMRFDPEAIRVGTLGVQRVLQHLGITADGPEPGEDTQFSRRTRWARASRSGIVHLEPELGDHVVKGARVGAVLDAYGKRLSWVTSPTDGIVIGQTQHPLVNRGDAVMHVAKIEPDAAEVVAL